MLTPALLILAATCDVPGERPQHWTPEQRQETYAIVRKTCEVAEVSHEICEALVAVTWRESRGMASRLHTKGPNEYGHGPQGFGMRWWSWLIPGATPEDFCDTPSSTLALVREWQRAWEQGAREIKQLQRKHAGRHVLDDSHPFADAKWCNLLKRGPRDDGHLVTWQVSCKKRLRREDLGTPVTDENFRALAARVHASL